MIGICKEREKGEERERDKEREKEREREREREIIATQCVDEDEGSEAPRELPLGDADRHRRKHHAESDLHQISPWREREREGEREIIIGLVKA